MRGEGSDDMAPPVKIPLRGDAELRVRGREVRLTNLEKPFWPELGITKSGLLQYYADVSKWLLPHVKGRAMVMKRYPNGAAGEYFYMKRAPSPRPEWIETCVIPHNAGPVEFPIVQDLPSLLWLINLGCIDLNPWYSPCSDYDRPDFLHFDLDPGPGADFEMIREAALLVRDALETLGMSPFAKTTGSKGIHVYVAIQRGPLQKQVWTVAKAIAFELASQRADLLTAEYRKVKRPHGRVLVDYNQNAWGRTLASIYSPRPVPKATVSAPITWEELEEGISMDEFRIETMRERLESEGDLWKPLLGRRRFDLEGMIEALTPKKKRAARKGKS